MVNRNWSKGKVVFGSNKVLKFALSVEARKKSLEWYPTTECNHLAASVIPQKNAAHTSPLPVPLFLRFAHVDYNHSLSGHEQ